MSNRIPRPPKNSDQEIIQKTIKLLDKLAIDNPDIEQTLWVSSYQLAVAISSIASGHSYQEYCEMMDEMKEHYKSWFKE